MPKARTATIATRRVRITGWNDACTINQPEVAVRATPQAVDRPPKMQAHNSRRRGNVSLACAAGMLASTCSASTCSGAICSGRSEERRVGKEDACRGPSYKYTTDAQNTAEK